MLVGGLEEARKGVCTVWGDAAGIVLGGGRRFDGVRCGSWKQGIQLCGGSRSLWTHRACVRNSRVDVGCAVACVVGDCGASRWNRGAGSVRVSN
jgi:hypothetical protein